MHDVMFRGNKYWVEKDKDILILCTPIMPTGAIGYLLIRSHEIGRSQWDKKYMKNAFPHQLKIFASDLSKWLDSRGEG